MGMTPPGKAQDMLVALGANLESAYGGPEQTVRRAIVRIGQTCGTVEAVSGLYDTPCFPVGAGPDFVNAALRLRSTLTPAQLLAQLHALEAEMGRVRKQRWAGRSLDLDLLACGQMILPDATAQQYWQNLTPERQRIDAPAELILPHPRMQDRAFVLVPLAEVAGAWRHPLSGLSAAQMLARLEPAERSAPQRR